MLTLRTTIDLESDSGFSLLEAVMGMAISTTMLLGTAGMIGYTGKASRSVTSSTDFNSLVSAVSMVLTHPNACERSSLIGRTFDPAALPFAVSPLKLTGNTVAELGEGTPGMKLAKLEFNQVIDNFPAASGMHTWVVNLRMEAEKSSSGDETRHFGSKVLGSDYKVALVVDADMKIVKCSGTPAGTTLPEACYVMGGEFDVVTNKCDYAQGICLRTGGEWDAAKKSCEHKTQVYLRTKPSLTTGNATELVYCDAGDQATGGGLETANPANSKAHYPLVSAGKAIGWTCHGTNIVNCHVTCMKTSWP